MAMRDKEAKREKRLVDYVCLVGIDQHVWNDLEGDNEDDNDDLDEDVFERTQQPQLLRRFPAQDHPDCKFNEKKRDTHLFIHFMYLEIFFSPSSE